MSVRKVGYLEEFEVREAILESNTSSVSILSFGAITKNWRICVDGSIIPILLGFDSLAAYQADKNFIGIIAGRVANRVNRGRFNLNGVEYYLSLNDYPHHLHGGLVGFGKRNWNLEFDSKKCAVQLTYVSGHLEEGYPGVVDVKVIVGLEGNTLTYEMVAIPDRPTPISLALHNYYNLMGSGTIGNHTIESIARCYTPTDKTLIPTGEIADLQNFRKSFGESKWDLRRPKTFHQLDMEKMGIDINLVMPVQRDMKSPIARVISQTGLILEICSDQPGLQFYSGKNLSSDYVGHNGEKYKAFAGFCLEPQKFPSSITIPSFPSIVCTPEHPYKQVTVVKVSNSK